jgi:hypothetical protein
MLWYPAKVMYMVRAQQGYEAPDIEMRYAVMGRIKQLII